MNGESNRGIEHLTQHKNDLVGTLDKLANYQESVLPINLTYFYNIALRFSVQNQSSIKDKVQIGLLGLDIPEELIYAVDALPLWVLGGSYGAALYADEFVPRDTDSVSKSILGYMSSDLFPFTQDLALTIVPITFDSMRKIAFQLKKERNVFPVDIPPVKTDSSSKRKWVTQMKMLRYALEKATGNRMTNNSLDRAVEMVNQAKNEMRRLLLFNRKYPEKLPGIVAMFIINTYFLAKDLRQWIGKLQELNVVLAGTMGRHHQTATGSPLRILLAGSPIFFPNYKIPLLLTDLNLDIAAYAHEMTSRIYTMPKLSNSCLGFEKRFASVVYTHYLDNCSPAFIDNISRMQYIAALDQLVPICGVIYHVLKGQIDYDFELERYEKFFQSRDIPFFRLETDYPEQDIEQLRIRIEAFAEMIREKKGGTGVKR